jgi:hypothetical protein
MRYAIALSIAAALISLLLTTAFAGGGPLSSLRSLPTSANPTTADDFSSWHPNARLLLNRRSDVGLRARTPS